MKSILAILLTLFGSWGAPAQEIQEGMLGPLPAMAANLRNPASHPAEWASLKEFLEKDDSNKHFYREGVYDCKHFSLELFRRAQTNEMACYIVLIRFAEIQEGHSVVCFPTMDKGDVFVDFTPIQMRDHQEPMKAIAMIAPRQPRIQVPLQQVPGNFTNFQPKGVVRPAGTNRDLAAEPASYSGPESRAGQAERRIHREIPQVSSRHGSLPLLRKRLEEPL
jgi:hypothetical protein